jgi:glycosyltransferase involved in cell wall biosynthesis
MIDRFTVLLPIFQREDLEILFDAAIESIYSNTVLPHEVLIVIDGPISRDFQVKVDFYRSKYSYIVLYTGKRVGLSEALNYGLMSATTDWIFRADGDDFSYPSRFEVQLKLLQSGYSLVGSQIREVDRQGVPLSLKKVPLRHSHIIKLFPFRNPFNHMSVAFSRKIALDCGMYPHIYLREDYGLWARFAKAGVLMVNVPDVLIDATCGHALYKRRSGLRYARAEFALQLHLLRCGLTNFLLAPIVCFSRLAIFLSPSFFHRFMYFFLFRKSI